MTERQMVAVLAVYLIGAVLLSYFLGSTVYAYAGEGGEVIVGFAYFGLLLAVMSRF
ncbi:hypothetical protein [Mesorhizobium sp. Cs1321R2N1]|uniref:hypothetical protein n=1 Tax=Mesorhizobium sp. Cs1321R2N1 TaxID=3015174 RepID=UPI00301C0B8C